MSSSDRFPLKTNRDNKTYYKQMDVDKPSNMRLTWIHHSGLGLPIFSAADRSDGSVGARLAGIPLFGPEGEKASGAVGRRNGHGSKARLPPVNIPISTEIGSKMGASPTPKWDPIAFDPQPFAPDHEKIRGRRLPWELDVFLRL